MILISLLFSNFLVLLCNSISSLKTPHVAVVGAGWGGWGAAKALCENGCKVTLIDSLSDPTGKTPYLTPTNKPFEAGTRGFWKDYPNIESIVSSLGLNEDEVFTKFTNSSFYSPDGLEASAPVSTIAGLLLAILDFDRDEKTFEAYDRMSAHELFIRLGVSKRLVDDFLKPTLLVGLFKPPEELSAAVVMELLYYYALAHQTSFDVRWIRNKTISEKIIAPLADSLSHGYDITVLGGSRVDCLVLDDSKSSVTEVAYTSTVTGEKGSLTDIDAVVLALGAKGTRAVVTGSPGLARAAPELAQAASLGSIDVIACRLWLDSVVPTLSPVNVFSRFDALQGAGGTFFLLDQLQGNSRELWGGEEPQGSVVACDFYNAGALMALSQEEIVSILINELLPSAVPAFRNAKVVDSHVQKFPGAVSWFSPGSFRKRPPLVVSSLENVVCAGDWVRMGEYEHGAKGLCQERAFVSGLQAANALARKGLLGSCRRVHPVIAIRDDEPQVSLGRAVNRQLKQFVEGFGLPGTPWVR